MHRVLSDRWLTSAAVALALACPALTGGAAAQEKPGIEAIAPSRGVVQAAPPMAPANDVVATADRPNTADALPGGAAAAKAEAEPTQPARSATETPPEPTPTAVAKPSPEAPPAAATAATKPAPEAPPPAATAATPPAPETPPGAPVATKPAPEMTPTAAAPPEATGTVAPQLAAAATADSAVAEKLREFAGNRFDRIFGRKDRAEIEAFYSARNFAPLWIANGTANKRARAAMDYLAGVDGDGLEPSDYPVPTFKDGLEPEALAETELRLTHSVLTYARHALRGRIHFTRVAADIEYELPKFEPGEVLAKLADAQDVAAVLDSFQPQHPGYKALKAKLAEVRNAKPEVKARIPVTKVVLRLGKDRKGKPVVMHDPRVPLLRERLGIDSDPESTAYDKTVADAVAKFQKAHGLPASGHLTAATIEAINGPRRDNVAEIIAVNMERWRWMPRDLGRIYVMVNIPDFRLRVVRDGKLVWTTKIVVGKPSLPTPIISAEMKYITVNPTWNVPPSIIKNEYLPALQQDPMALERIGLKVVQNPDGTVRIYQPPGDRNALGRIRFNFPNRFLVYQHDTPDKHLFAHARRAYSHGCMRVQDPLKYGEVLLSLVLPNENYTQERLRKMFGGSEVNINFPTFIPVHLTYQTAFVDDAGELQIRDDVYGRDARMFALLKGSDRKVADVPMERPRTTSTAPVRMPPGTFGGSYARGPSFFDFLFGGALNQPPRPPRRVTRSGNPNVR